MEPKRLDQILQVIESGKTNAGEIRGALGDEFSYGEIRMVIAHRKSKKGESG